MFNRLCFRPQDWTGGSFDAGALAESLLFYQHVTAVVDRGSLGDLVRKCHPLVLVSLMQDGDLDVLYLNNGLGVQTVNSGSDRERHDFACYAVRSDDLSELVGNAFRSSTKNDSDAKRAARKFLKLVKLGTYEPHLTDAVRADMLDEGMSCRRLRILLAHLCPEYKWVGNEFLKLEQEAEGFAVYGNIDFDRLNELYRRRVSPTHSTLTPALLLSHLFGIKGELFLSSTLNAELATRAISASLIQSEFEYLVRRRIKAEHQLKVFQEFIFAKAHAIREAINSGKVTFPEIRQTVGRARKFKEWLAGKSPDGDLLKEYYSATTKDSWVEKLPTKTARWGVFTGAELLAHEMGAGMPGIAGAVAVSAFNEFLIDKVLKGWKPSHFVEEHLKKAIKGVDQVD